MIIEVTVVPSSPRFHIAVKNGRLKVSLVSEAERNRANIELIQGLSKALGVQVRIISGLTSKRKKLSADIGEAEWSAFLGSLG